MFFFFAFIPFGPFFLIFYIHVVKISHIFIILFYFSTRLLLLEIKLNRNKWMTDLSKYQNDLVYMKYLPITSVDVVKSFQIYKNILKLNSISFSENSLTKYMIQNLFF